MKKKLYVLAVLAIILAGAVTGTLAYYTAKGTAHNVITTSSVGIHIEEYQLVDGEKKDYPTEAVKIMPGSTVSKRPEVVNDEEPSYIRACVEVCMKQKGSNKLKVLTDEEVDAFMEFKMNGNYWKQDGEDTKWWYYTPGEVGTGYATQPLFTEVHFKGAEMDNSYMNAEIQINIAGQAVQAKNNPIPEKGHVWDVGGWPKD